MLAISLSISGLPWWPQFAPLGAQAPVHTCRISALNGSCVARLILIALIFVAHDLNPRAMSPKVKGFVQAQSWFQDLTPVTLSP